MRYYVISGEASGDLHGAELIKAIRARDQHAEFRSWGGDLMATVSDQLVKHYRDLAFMGFVEVAKHLPTILRNIRFCKQDITAYAPDAVILIDYPGFNLRIAKWAHAQGLKIFYYISPQVWAWHKSRISRIRESVDQMYVILPFEKEFYSRYGVEVQYVGHPLTAVIGKYRLEQATKPRLKHIAVLPGSRRQEIRDILPIMSATFRAFPEELFYIAGAPHIPVEFYRGILKNAHDNYKILQGQAYRILYDAKCALTASGTATLETALFDVPQVVCYKGNSISFALAKWLVDVKYISLVNLIADKPLVKELIQTELTVQNLSQELSDLLKPDYQDQIRGGYAELHAILGNEDAAANTAGHIVNFLSHQA